MNHAASLGHAAHGAYTSAHFILHCNFFAHSVCRHDSISCIPMMFCGKSLGQRMDGILDRFNRKGETNDTGGCHNDLFRLNPQFLCGKLAHTIGLFLSVRIAGVGILAVGNDSSRDIAALGQIALRHQNRCTLHFIGGVYRCCLTRCLRIDQSQIMLLLVRIQSTV